MKRFLFRLSIAITFIFIGISIAIFVMQRYAVDLSTLSSQSSGWVENYRIQLLIFRVGLYLVLFFSWDKLASIFKFNEDTRSHFRAVKVRFFIFVLLFDVFAITNILQYVS